jgi:PTH1 family peptidyl-tRNA hydrolase
MSIRLIVGLGNPGQEHQRTRHNAGFWFLDALAARLSCRLARDAKRHGDYGKVSLESETLWLMKPSTYMNRSGMALMSAWNYYKIQPEQTLVAHDDLDLAPGTVRLKFDGGHGGQNGLRDIIEQLGHGRFHRLRLGIGHPGHKDQVTSWVLGRPGQTDEAQMLAAVGAALDEVPAIARGEFNAAMQRLHTKKT